MINPSSEINTNGGKCYGKKDEPYTVTEWCLTKKEDTDTSNGKTYHWCNADHYSVGTKYNGMYADHKSCDHDAWQAHLDANRNARTNEKTSDRTSKPVDAPVGYCSGYYKARRASGRASGKKYEAQIVIFCILLAVNRFSRISLKGESR